MTARPFLGRYFFALAGRGAGFAASARLSSQAAVSAKVSAMGRLVKPSALRAFRLEKLSLERIQ